MNLRSTAVNGFLAIKGVVHAILLILSVSLLFGSSWMWARSYRVRDSAEYLRRAGGRFRFWSCEGRFMVWTQKYDWTERPDVVEFGLTEWESQPSATAVRDSSEFPPYRFLGFGLEFKNSGGFAPMAYYALVTPYWFLVFLAMLIPGVWLRRSAVATVGNGESPTNRSATSSIHAHSSMRNSKRRMWQFSLRTLLLGVLIVSVGLSWLRTVVHQTAPHWVLVAISSLWPLGLFLRFVRHRPLFKKTRTETAAVGR